MELYYNCFNAQNEYDYYVFLLYRLVVEIMLKTLWVIPIFSVLNNSGHEKKFQSLAFLKRTVCGFD